MTAEETQTTEHESAPRERPIRRFAYLAEARGCRTVEEAGVFFNAVARQIGMEEWDGKSPSPSAHWAAAADYLEANPEFTFRHTVTAGRPPSARHALASSLGIGGTDADLDGGGYAALEEWLITVDAVRLRMARNAGRPLPPPVPRIRAGLLTQRAAVKEAEAERKTELRAHIEADREESRQRRREYRARSQAGEFREND